MAEPHDIAVIVGSLRKESLSRKTALALAKIAAPTIKLDILEIGDLALYNQDTDENPPATWTKFRQAVKAHKGVLFVTPEYNRSVPAPLKNAIDVGSRPYGQSAWANKPAGIVSISPGALGAFGANHHLRQSLVFLDMPVLQQPEAYLGGVGNWFDESGNLKDEKAREFLRKFIDAYAKWVEKHHA